MRSTDVTLTGRLIRGLRRAISCCGLRRERYTSARLLFQASRPIKSFGAIVFCFSNLLVVDRRMS